MEPKARFGVLMARAHIHTPTSSACQLFLFLHIHKGMRFTPLLLLVSLMIFVGCTPQSQPETLPEETPPIAITPKGFPSIDLSNYFDTHSDQLQEVALPYDPVSEEKNQRYRGLPLAPLLAEIESQLTTKDPSNQASWQIEFVCTDGYRPQVSLEKLSRHQGYIVHQKYDPNSNSFGPLPNKFAPYYLIWTDTDDTKEVSWPYALASMRLIDPQSNNYYLYPLPDTSALAGLTTYETHCLKCHSINGVGGIMGPEFNYPRNLLEYWNGDSLYSFVTHPQGFRYRSTMPAIPNITPEEISLIRQYLEYIGDHKIKPRDLVEQES